MTSPTCSRRTQEPDLQLLAAEVVLTERRRQDPSLKPTRWQSGVALIEPVLAKAPNNTAAIHYIHATEVAGMQTALPYAEKRRRWLPMPAT